MRIKVRGGTIEGGDGTLCVSCRNAVIVKGPNLKSERVMCEKFPYGSDAEVTFPVKECSVYDYKATTSVHDMYATAWVLRTDGKGRSIGFVPYKNLTREEKEDF